MDTLTKLKLRAEPNAMQGSEKNWARPRKREKIAVKMQKGQQTKEMVRNGLFAESFPFKSKCRGLN